MKKVTLLFVIMVLATLTSGAYAYSEGMLDEILAVEDEEEDTPPVSSTGNAPIETSLSG